MASSTQTMSLQASVDTGGASASGDSLPHCATHIGTLMLARIIYRSHDNQLTNHTRATVS